MTSTVRKSDASGAGTETRASEGVSFRSPPVPLSVITIEQRITDRTREAPKSTSQYGRIEIPELSTVAVSLPLKQELKFYYIVCDDDEMELFHCLAGAGTQSVPQTNARLIIKNNRDRRRCVTIHWRS